MITFFSKDPISSGPKDKFIVSVEGRVRCRRLEQKDWGHKVQGSWEFLINPKKKRKSG